MNGHLKTCTSIFSDKLVFILSHKVKASMRKNTYNTKVAFSADDLIACQCSCKCGAEKNERILCAHPLVLMMDLFLLLFEGLAQNILLELRDRFKMNGLHFLMKILDHSILILKY